MGRPGREQSTKPPTSLSRSAAVANRPRPSLRVCDNVGTAQKDDGPSPLRSILGQSSVYRLTHEYVVRRTLFDCQGSDSGRYGPGYGEGLSCEEEFVHII